MNNLQPGLAHCLALLNHEQEIRQANSLNELSFLMVNRSQVLVDAGFVVYWQSHRNNKAKISKASSLLEIDSNTSPLIHNLEQLASAKLKKNEESVTILSDAEIAPLELQQFYNWTHSEILWCPLKSKNYRINSGLILVRERKWSDDNILLARRLSEMYGFATQVLGSQSSTSFSKIGWLKKPLSIVMLLMLTFFIPVSQSVIAPATIIAKQPDIVTAPIDGVIESIIVKPNEAVEKNQILVKFEQSSIKNRVDIATKVLKVAEAKYLKTQQLSFNNNEMKAQLALLKAQMEQRVAEVNYAKLLLERTQLRAMRSGIAIIDDINQLVGKPVQIGEKILTVADPQQVEIEIQLAVSDAIVMDTGAAVELFLNMAPANAIHAELYYVGYTAKLNTDGLLAYQLLAKIKTTELNAVKQDSGQVLPRIGLKGSAKIYGAKVSLFYYLFRRPLSVLRQSIGF